LIFYQRLYYEYETLMFEFCKALLNTW